MNWWLAYNVGLAVGLILAIAWAFDARRLMRRALRLVELNDDSPTEELELPPQFVQLWPPERR